MAKRPHQSPEDEDLFEAESLRSRSDARRERMATEDILARLAKDIVTLSTRRLEQLELPEGVLEAVLVTRKITSAPARNRQLRVVRGALRDTNWGAIRRRMEELLERGVISAPLLGEAQAESAGQQAHWVARLMGGGSGALEEFIKERESADRKHLRQLIRNAQRASGERKRAAERRLEQAVAALLRVPQQKTPGSSG